MLHHIKSVHAAVMNKNAGVLVAGNDGVVRALFPVDQVCFNCHVGVPVATRITMIVSVVSAFILDDLVYRHSMPVVGFRTSGIYRSFVFPFALETQKR